MNARHIIDLLRRWFWLVVLACFLGGGAGLVVSLVQPKSYQSSAMLYIQSPNHSDYQTLLGDQEAAKAFATFPLSGMVLQATLHALHENSLTVSKLASMISIINVRQTQFVTISVRAGSPRQAAKLANEVTKQAVLRFQSLETDTKAVQFSRHEMDALRLEILSLEQQVEAAQRQARPTRVGNTPAIQELSKTLNVDRTLYNQLVNAATGMNAPRATIMQTAVAPKGPTGLAQAKGRVTAIIMGMLVALIVFLSVLLFIESVYGADAETQRGVRIA